VLADKDREHQVYLTKYKDKIKGYELQLQ